jgi:PIN domain nuclease of toxin-antitoxin system
MQLVLDTCAIIHAVSGPEQLSGPTRDLLEAGGTTVWVSPISCAEVARAVERGRLALDRHWRLWFKHFVTTNGWRVQDIDLRIMEEAFTLPEPFHRDLADRIIVATARKLSCSVVTTDRKILEYPHVESIS